jgi:leader peptidase (prepilin peptidase)/N-methyltransferase
MNAAAVFAPWLASAFGTVLGAIVGSFLATVLLRWPAGQSALGGRSRCDGCRRTLAPAELVPVLSFAWNRGRCRACGVPIGRVHLLIELAAAVIGGVAFALVDPIAASVWAVLGWGLLLLAALDWRHFWLPDAMTLGLAVVGLALGGRIGAALPIDRLIGLAAGFGVLWAIARAYRAARNREGMGGGDPKLLGAIGAWFGWQALPFVLLAASALGLLLALVAAARGRPVSAATALPLGTLLCIAALPGWLGARALGIG